MSLDISFTRRKKIICPKCGEFVGHTDLATFDSGGRLWYPFLEEIGYYIPYDKRTEENDWYGKDMVLTAEQTKYAYTFVQEVDAYNGNEIVGLIAFALLEKDDIVINADWWRLLGMPELKPCPFCGSPVEIKVIGSGLNKRSVIRCKSLDCYMGYSGSFTSWHNGDTDEHAALRLSTAWNRRHEEHRPEIDFDYGAED